MIRVKTAFGRLFSKGADEQIVATCRPIDAFTALLIGDGGAGPISPRSAMNHYSTNAVLATVVDRIASAVAQIDPVVVSRGNIIEGHPIERLLDEPGFGRTRRQFIQSLAVHYLVAGNAFPILIGNTRTIPVGLDYASPVNIELLDGPDGHLIEVQHFDRQRQQMFRRDGRSWRFLFGNFAEVGQVVEIQDDENLWGRSRLSAIRSDVRQRTKGAQHNEAMLSNGASPSLLISYADGMTGDQAAIIKEKIEATMTGPENAGRVIVSSGGAFEAKPISLTNRDMDYAGLMSMIAEAIYARYGIPLPLVSATRQTFSNYSEAIRAVYQDAVLPAFGAIYDELSRMLMPRYGDDESYLTYDKRTIDVLYDAAIDRAVKVRKEGLLTINEARATIGEAPIAGGDLIYGPSSLAPLAEDMDGVGGEFDPFETGGDATSAEDDAGGAADQTDDADMEGDAP